MNPIIQTEKLTHIYSAGTPFQHTALDGVELSVYPGEYLGIIGHTGSGKSTLIQHLNGLLKPTSGRVLVDNQDIWASKEATRQARFTVGLVFQYPEYQLFEETVYKDIAFGPKNMGLSEKEVEHRVREAAAFVGLGDSLLEASPFELSGGQKRRVAIAGVIAMEPKVLILDEPTAGLDPAGASQILGNIFDYKKAKSATIIMVSHSMEDMARTADRLVVIDGGKIPFEGAPKEVFSHVSELESMGLGVPHMTHVFHLLREKGVQLDPSVYTVPQAKEAILAELRSKSPSNASIFTPSVARVVHEQDRKGGEI